jgi:acetyl esterase/lipase
MFLRPAGVGALTPRYERSGWLRQQEICYGTLDAKKQSASALTHSLAPLIPRQWLQQLIRRPGADESQWMGKCSTALPPRARPLFFKRAPEKEGRIVSRGVLKIMQKNRMIAHAFLPFFLYFILQQY